MGILKNLIDKKMSAKINHTIYHLKGTVKEQDANIESKKYAAKLVSILFYAKKNKDYKLFKNISNLLFKHGEVVESKTQTRTLYGRTKALYDIEIPRKIYCLNLPIDVQEKIDEVYEHIKKPCDKNTQNNITNQNYIQK